MHEVAVRRLRRGQEAIARYFQVRIEQRLGETFDDWCVGICEDDRAPAPSPGRVPVPGTPAGDLYRQCARAG